MRRGLTTLTAAALVLVAGVAAAAAASGDSPLDLLRAKPAKHAVQRPRATSSALRAHPRSTAPRASTASARDDDLAKHEDEDSKGGTTSEETAAEQVSTAGGGTTSRRSLPRIRRRGNQRTGKAALA